MAGQRRWALPGSAVNGYPIVPRIQKDIFFQSEYRTIFGRINRFRELKTIIVERDGGQVQLSQGGNESPIWQQDFSKETMQARFTYEDSLTGKLTYGTADVKPGEFDTFRHCVVDAVQRDTPAFPLVDKMSQDRIAELMPNVLENKKGRMSQLREKWTEIAAFHALMNGADGGLIGTENGGLGSEVLLPGCTAGQTRSCYNNIIAGANALVVPSYTRATHEQNVRDAINSLTDDKDCGFNYDEHKKMSYWVGKLRFKPTTISGKTIRSVAIADPRLIYRLTQADQTLSNLWKIATERSDKNLALDGMQAAWLDDILYIPSQYLEYFRPTLSGSAATYLGLTTDPFDSGFVNTSNYCPIIYMGAGALLRGVNSQMSFTVSGEGASDAGHKKGTTVSLHWYDGWRRAEWFRNDGASELRNESSIIWWGYDPGVGKAFAA